MCISSFTPPTEPGILPTASANTTLRRTVPFFRCNRPAGIFVKKLNSASEPTATRAGTFRPKIRIGSSRTPPPTPLMPISTPTKKPTRILAASSGISGSRYSPARLTPMKPSRSRCRMISWAASPGDRSEEHTSELQSLRHLVCRLLLEKTKHSPRRVDHQSAHHLTDTAATALGPASVRVRRQPVAIGLRGQLHGRQASSFFFFNQTGPRQFLPLPLPVLSPP